MRSSLNTVDIDRHRFERTEKSLLPGGDAERFVQGIFLNKAFHSEFLIDGKYAIFSFAAESFQPTMWNNGSRFALRRGLLTREKI
jgi:hypothetical protein